MRAMGRRMAPCAAGRAPASRERCVWRRLVGAEVTGVDTRHDCVHMWLVFFATPICRPRRTHRVCRPRSWSTHVYANLVTKESLPYCTPRGVHHGHDLMLHAVDLVWCVSRNLVTPPHHFVMYRMKKIASPSCHVVAVRDRAWTWLSRSSTGAMQEVDARAFLPSALHVRGKRDVGAGGSMYVHTAGTVTTNNP